MRRKLQALGSFAAPFFLRNNGADRTKLARRCFLAQVFSLTFHGLASQAERPRTKPLKIMMSSPPAERSEEHTSELQSRSDLVCRLLLEKKKYCLVQLAPASLAFNLCRRTLSLMFFAIIRLWINIQPCYPRDIISSSLDLCAASCWLTLS